MGRTAAPPSSTVPRGRPRHWPHVLPPAAPFCTRPKIDAVSPSAEAPIDQPEAPLRDAPPQRQPSSRMR
eukprot:1940926-Prymnesium_polylepis.1